MEDIRNNLLFPKNGEITLLVRDLIVEDEKGERRFPLSYLSILRAGEEFEILGIKRFEREIADVKFINRMLLKSHGGKHWKIGEIDY
ncbi:MAG: hypothetical protein K2G69_09810 [Muribaculaceae bacterium]|nr:hypothetical protein [Muribaculaceae bacterium]MDE5976833.1 hypothetical protein [Muribaculaceae bacterium]